MRETLVRVRDWLRAPVPSRPLTVWTTLAPLGVVVIVAAVVPMRGAWKARIAMAGLGLVVASIGIVRPTALWDHGRLKSWRDVFGDRVVWLLYLAIGAGCVSIALLAPVT